jgi:predicted nucleotidyltransferase
MDDRSGPVRSLHEGELKALHASHQADTPLPFSDFARIQSRKVNEGYFAETPYFIRFVKLRQEAEEQYGNPVFKPLGTATIEFRVNDARNAIFTPCRYGIDTVVFLDRGPESDLREMVSFRGRFSDQVRAGERARARGILERVTAADGAVHHRLMVGGKTGDLLVVAP